MTTSPLQFARDWEQLQSRLREQPHDDLRLLSLAEFWPQLKPRVDDPAFQTYQREYLSLLDDALKAVKAHDLSASEWAAILAALEEIAAQFPQPELASGIQLSLKELARLHFYVGNIESGLLYAQRLAGVVAVPKVDLSSLENIYEIDALRRLIEMLGESDSAVKAQLEAILAEWTLERESVRHDAIHCLFIERESSTGAARGRLRTLEGEIELGRGNDAPDELTCHNQVIAPDDPFIGVGYASLAAVRDALKRQSITIADGRRIHARYKINSSNSVFSGDSIGLAMALVAYTQALRPLVRWHERYLSGEVAVTAAIDDSGRLLPINTQTLAAKIDRAFFSHVRYLVVPESNAEAARARLESLRQTHPRRQLLLITAATLTDVISDHNVVRAERICLGQFVARKAYRYSRMTTVQIPLLLVLGYLLLCIIYPKAWIGFDWNPAQVSIEGKEARVSNSSGYRLWEYTFSHEISDGPDVWKIANIDDDSLNEVLLIPFRRGYFPLNGQMHWFDDNGTLLRITDCITRGKYPESGSEPLNEFETEGGGVHTVAVNRSVLILTTVGAQQPSRSYIRVWSTNGKPISWYINSGAVQFLTAQDIDFDDTEELIFTGTNNRLGCQSLFALDALNSEGVSPPYDVPGFDFSWVIRGNQKRLIFFKPTLVHRYLGARGAQDCLDFRLLDNGGLQVILNEGSAVAPAYLVVEFDSTLCMVSSSCGDGFEKRLGLLVERGFISESDSARQMSNLPASVEYYYADRKVDACPY